MNSHTQRLANMFCEKLRCMHQVGDNGAHIFTECSKEDSGGDEEAVED